MWLSRMTAWPRPRRSTSFRLTAAGTGTDEVGNEIVGGLPQDAFRGVILHDAGAFVEDGNPVAQLGGLVKVVGDAHNGFAELRLDIDELVLEALAGDRVDGAEGFAHEVDRRVRGQGAGHRVPGPVKPG